MCEQLEVVEQMEETMELRGIAQEIECLQSDYNEAIAGGFEDVAKSYQEKIKELKEKLERKDPPPQQAGGHQAGRLETLPEVDAEVSEKELGTYQGYEDSTEEDELGAHQGSASREISFGSSDVERAAKRMAEWNSEAIARGKRVEEDAKFNRDTTKSMSDLKSAQKQYAQAEREWKWAKEHSN